MKIILKLVVLFVVVLNTQTANSQNIKTHELISVKGYIFGSKSSFCSNEGDTTFVGVATVTNNQDTTISFWIMSLSWPIVNWGTDNASVQMVFHGADANYPVKIKLSPNKSADFYCQFRKNSTKKNVEFRIGFFYFPDPGPPSIFDKDKSKVKIFWSDTIKLKDYYDNRVEY